MEKTHPNKDLHLNVGGVSNQILQLLPFYEKCEDLKISIVTKYSEYKPSTSRVKIYQLYKFKNYTISSLYFLFKSFFKIIKIQKKEPINLISIEGYPYIILSPFIIKLLFKIPIIMKIPIDNESYLRQIQLLEKNPLLAKIYNYSWFKFFIKFIIKKIDFIRPINDKMYNELIELNFPDNRILKIPNGINSNYFYEIKKKDHETTHFGYVGRLTEFKNLRFLLEVFKLYLSRYPKDKLLFYGKGSEETWILEFIKNNKLRNNIILCGFEKDKTVIYSNIDVIIDPAYGQGISNTNLEAMCSNTLVIASNVYGNKDLIKHGKNGLLFNPFKKNDLLKQLFFFKENRDSIQQLLINAKNEIILNYDIEIIANKMNSFFKKNFNHKKNRIK